VTDSFTAALRDWQGYYQMLGESAATLTGLMFVAVALGARLFTPAIMPLVRTFISPTLGHFLAALILAALLCIPTQTRLSLAGELGVCGLIGLGRVTVLFGCMRRHHRHLPVHRRHWLCHLALPALGYLCVPTAAAGLWRSWPSALPMLAAGVLLLIVTGVINAWDIALQSFLVSPEDIQALNLE
jgi:hypothetical protein